MRNFTIDHSDTRTKTKRWLGLLTFCMMLLMGQSVLSQTYYTIGTSEGTNSSSQYPSPLGDYYENQRSQTIYLASDLTAAGLTSGFITHLRWNIIDLQGAGLIENFSIKLGTTSDTSLGQSANSWITTTEVFGPVDYLPVVGENVFDITDFVWDGVSNIVVEVCSGKVPSNDGVYYTNNPAIAYQTMPYNVSLTYRVDNATTSTCNYSGAPSVSSGFVYANRRPLIDFGWLPLPDCSGTPNGGVASASPNNGNPDSVFSVNVSGSTAAEGLSYQWEISLDNVVWEEINGETSPVLITTAPTIVGTTVYYRRKTTCTTSNESDYSSVAQFTTTLTYCTSEPSSLDHNGISNVTLNSVSFPVGVVTYYNYTGSVIDITPGLMNEFFVNFETNYSYHINVWIDFNDNGEFDSDELVYQGESVQTGTSAPIIPYLLDATFYLNVSTANQQGVHKMRIGTADTGQSTPNPCYSGTYGVTIDLMVNVLPLPLCVIPIDVEATNMTHYSADLSWVETATATTWDIEYGLSGFIPTGTPMINVTASPYTLSGLSAYTEYEFYLRSNCGLDGVGPWVGPFSFKTAFDCTSYAGEITSTTGGDICVQGTTTLQATASGLGDAIYWYDAESGGNLVGIGNSFETPELTSTTSFWTTEVELGTELFTGQGNLNATTLSSTTNGGITFVLNKTASIISFEARSTTAAGGAVTYALIDVNNNNSVLMTHDDTLPGGGTATSPVLYTVQLNFNNIPPGTYRLIKQSGAASAYMTGAFPYPLGNLGQVTTGAAGATSTSTLYYHFFNITIESSKLLCESAREEVVAVVNGAAPLGEANQQLESGDTLADLDVTATGTLTWYTDDTLTTVIPDTTAAVNGTTYYVTQTIDGCESAPLAITTTVSLSFPAPYCNVSFPSDVEPITLVQFNTIDNASSATINGSPALENFTAISTDVMQTESYLITLKGNTGGNYINIFTVYIDWNQDGDFSDAGETYQIGQISNSSGLDNVSASGLITVPADATLGSTRMRVIKKFSVAADACNTLGYGQAEDYTINVLPPPPCLTPANLSAEMTSLTSVQISWNGTAASYDLEWGAEGFTQGSGTLVSDITTTSYVISSLTADTSYQFYVRQNCGTDGVSSWVGPYTLFVGYCQAGAVSLFDEKISNVTFQDINNSSTSSSGYEDFTAISTEVTQGESYNFSVTLSEYYDTDEVLVWIDFNQDGDFNDPGEAVLTLEMTSTSGGGNITIPMNATLGATRMRIRLHYADYQENYTPCGNSGYGQVEDYTVIIMPSCNLTTPTGATAQTLESGDTLADLDVTGDDLVWYADAALTTVLPNSTVAVDGTTYYVVSESGPCQSESLAITVTVSLSFPAPYCNVSFPSDVEPITLVQFNTIDNASSATINGSPALENFTAISTDVMQTESYLITLKGNTGGNYINIFTVYIDWNQDGDFSDAGETYQIGQISNSSGLDNVSASGLIAVPADATLGSTRMRVIKKFSVAADACNSTGFGQAEDYTINVLPPPPCLTPANLSAEMTSLTSVQISWNGTAASYDLEWGVEGFTQGSGTLVSDITTTSYVISSLTADTSYQFYVRQNCGTDGVSSWVGPYTLFVGYCQAGAVSLFDEKISNVTFQDINNSSTSSSGYEDFTAISTEVTQGESYNFSVTLSEYYDTDEVLVWIDFNQDGDFNDPGEAVLTLEMTSTSGGGNITIPMNATLGATRMRIRLHYADYQENYTPCGNSGYGQVEDYTVIIMPSCNLTTPTGATAQTLESGDTLADLDVTGDDLVWYADAALTTVLPNSTVAVDGTTYYVVSESGSCQSAALAITVTVTSVDPCSGITVPTGATAQTLELGDTLADLDVTGTNLVWYADAALTTVLPNSTVAVDGTTYYVVSETTDCQSAALAITVTVIDPCAGVTTPTGASTQTLNIGGTLADLTIEGTNLVWYADAALTTVLPNTTVAVDGTTYYVVSETGDCQSEALAITVTVIDPCADVTAPTGDTVQTVADGSTLADLAVNGTNLSWFEDADLTQSLPATTVVENGTTYYVASVTDVCVSEALAITVYIEGVDPCDGVTVPAPTGEALQTVSEGTTLADLVVDGENLQWYADADLTQELDSTTVVEDGVTYYVTQTIGLCTSAEALEVTVQVTVGREDFDSFAFRFYPNPVGDVLNLSSNSEISNINLFNMLGQKVTVVANANNTQVDMSALPTGNYIISITIEGVTKTFKVVKN